MSQKVPVTRADFDRYLVPSYAPSRIVPVRGRGSRVWDQQGHELIDFGGGIAVTGLGHAHPALVAAITEQANTLWHASNLFTNEPALRLARKLVEATFADKVFFANSGAEANEAAFKLGRRYGANTGGENKYEIVSAINSFHGRTLFTVNVTGQAKYSSGFGPRIEGVRHVAFNDIAALEAAVGPNTCAVVIEPIQGESGVIPADPAYLKRARELCDANKALLIFDEVQTGMGRIGKLFAYEHYGVVPDVLTSAKSLGNGFPIGAMLTTDAIAGHFTPGTHGSTYGGNPLGCAAAEVALDIINSPEVLEGIPARHERFMQRLEKMAKDYGVFSQVRGMGLLIGAVLSSQWQGQAADFVRACEDQDLLILQAGPNVLRFAPSLIIDFTDIDEGLDRLERAIKTYIGARESATA